MTNTINQETQTIAVKEVLCRHDSVVVVFADGHEMRFEPYTHGFGYQIEGLRKFVLLKDEKEVCLYSGRLYRCGPSEDENVITFIDNGYTQEQVAHYWDIARKGIDKLFNPDGQFDNTNKDYWYAWKVLGEGWEGFNNLREGRARVYSRKSN